MDDKWIMAFKDKPCGKLDINCKEYYKKSVLSQIIFKFRFMLHEMEEIFGHQYSIMSERVHGISFFNTKWFQMRE